MSLQIMQKADEYSVHPRSNTTVTNLSLVCFASVEAPREKEDSNKRDSKTDSQKRAKSKENAKERSRDSKT